MNWFHPIHRVRIQAFAGAAPDLFVSGADVEDLGALQVHHPEHFPNVFRQLAEFFLAALQGLLRLLAIGDVFTGANEPQELPVGEKRGAAMDSIHLHWPSNRRLRCSPLKLA